MYSFPDLQPVCCSMSSSHADFSEGRSGSLVFPSLEEFSTVCCDPHSQRLWHSQWNRIRCYFWNSLAFSMIQWMLAIWYLVPLPFLNPACISGSSQITYCWSLAWKILSIPLLIWNECNCIVVLTFLALPFFGIGMKTDRFQPCGHCWVFQIGWHIALWQHLLGF